MSRIARLLNVTVPVYRAVAQPDGGGGQATTWTQVGALRARRSQPSATERARGDQAGAHLDETWYFDPAADVRYGDELRPDGRVLEVIATFEPSELGTYLRVDCTTRQPEES